MVVKTGYIFPPMDKPVTVPDDAPDYAYDAAPEAGDEVKAAWERVTAISG